MSTASVGWAIPKWNQTDRLAKSLKESGLSVQQMADYFDVHRNTVSGWLHGRITPDTRTLRLWALRTAVPYEWIKDGTEPPGPSGGDGDGLPTSPDDDDPTGGRPTKRFATIHGIYQQIQPDDDVDGWYEEAA